ncbi:MAG: helix-turn-helix domain-containing protein [Geodermatophilaceae bacterium]
MHSPPIVSGLIAPGNGGFGIGVLAEVYGYDRRDLGIPAFDFALVAEKPGPMRTDTGILITIEHGLERLARSDVIQIPSWGCGPGPVGPVEPPTPDLLAALHTAHARGATIATHCTGAFVLAHAGLLDGRRATTHWGFADLLAQTFPSVTVDSDVLYVDEGQLVTGAGTAAGIDLCLYLIRRDYGAKAANALARTMVVSPHREGGQAQFIATPVANCAGTDPLRGLLQWMRAHLDEELSVPQLAHRVLMSERSFARHFRAATGTTPHAWVLAQRLGAAEQLLEAGTDSVEHIARTVGFGTAAGMREQFVRRRGVSPQAYRRTFASRPAVAAMSAAAMSAAFG